MKLHSRLSQAKCDFRRKSAVLRFEPPLGGLGATYDDHLRLIENHVVGFLLVLIEPFSVGITLRRYERISVQNRRFRSIGAG